MDSHSSDGNVIVVDDKDLAEIKSQLTNKSDEEKISETIQNDNKSTAETAEENSATENCAADGEDTEKRPKKDKVKKRWSFRSFSFSKKDKQKPSKKDEAKTADSECALVPEEVSIFVLKKKKKTCFL